MHIYLLRHRGSGKCYVGLTTHTDVTIRWSQHKNGGNPRNDATYIAKAIQKHGWDAFDKTVLETCHNREALMNAERRWICELNCMAPNGYNLTTGGESWEASAEVKAARSRAMMGHRHSEDTCRKIGKANSGRMLSPEHKRKISEGLLRTGRTVSEENRKKLMDANRGENNPFSKLSWDLVRAIRAEYASGTATQYDLAKSYHVSVATVSRLVNNKIWQESSTHSCPIDHRFASKRKCVSATEN